MADFHISSRGAQDWEYIEADVIDGRLIITVIDGYPLFPSDDLHLSFTKMQTEEFSKWLSSLL